MGRKFGKGAERQVNRGTSKMIVLIDSTGALGAWRRTPVAAIVEEEEEEKDVQQNKEEVKEKEKEQ